MEALRAQSPTSGLAVETVPIPTLGPDDVLIRVTAASLNPGVVRMIKMGRSHAPSTLGHEAAGTISAIGGNVRGFVVGARVRLHPVLSCNSCFNCLHGQENLCDTGAILGFAYFGRPSSLYERYHDGTLAEYVRAPHWLVDPLPDNVSYEVGAKVHDVATALRALRLANIKHDSTVVLTAATGAMGSLTLRLTRLFPVKKIILVGRSKERLEQVRSLATVATEVLATDSQGPHSKPLAAQLSALAPEGIDVMIDYFPAGYTLAQILPVLRLGGTLVHMGGNLKPLQIPLVLIMSSSWTVTGSRANTREDVRDVLRWLGEGRLYVDDLITHRFSLREVGRMLELAENRNEPVWLSIVNLSR